MVAAARQPGLEVHRHHRSLEARHDGPRAGCHAAARRSGRRSTSSTSTCAAFACSRASRSTSWKRADSTWTTTCLAEADWVVASVHYGQNQSREQITKRVIDALANPYVSAIAHPTGRLINRRKPYEIDLEAVFKAARDHGKMMELNANPAPARPGRRGLRGGQEPWHSDRHFQRRAQHRRLGRAALRQCCRPAARGLDEERRGQHAAARQVPGAGRQGAKWRRR